MLFLLLFLLLLLLMSFLILLLFDLIYSMMALPMTKQPTNQWTSPFPSLDVPACTLIIIFYLKTTCPDSRFAGEMFSVQDNAGAVSDEDELFTIPIACADVDGSSAALTSAFSDEELTASRTSPVSSDDVVSVGVISVAAAIAFF